MLLRCSALCLEGRVSDLHALCTVVSLEQATHPPFWAEASSSVNEGGSNPSCIGLAHVLMSGLT